MRRPSLHRIVLAVALLAGCAAPNTPPAPNKHAGGPAPYDVPGGDRGELGPVPVTANDPARGRASALVTIVEFAEFQCPYCTRAAQTMNELQREYGSDKVRVVWKHFPLAFHAKARPAAEVGVALFERGGSAAFFRYHDAIFGAQRPLDGDLIDEAAERAGASPGEIERALRRGTAAAKVDADVDLAGAVGVTGTPAFFINGSFISGAQPIEKFRAIVDAELARAEGALAAGTPPGRLYAVLTAQAFSPPKKAEAAARPEDRTLYRVPVAGSPVLGKPTALVTLVEFADFQCPYCTRAEPTLRDLRARYGDDLRIVWKNQPLPFHKRAEAAAELALEARAQKGEAAFWSVQSALLGQRGQLDDDDLEVIAKQSGLNVKAAMRAVAQQKHGAAIEEDMDLAEDIGATGTPTFFINGRKLTGAQPFDAFAAVIDEQLAAARAVVARGVAPAKVYETLQQGAVSMMPEKVAVAALTSAHPVRGPAGAKVVIHMWSDFECPFCRRVEPTLLDLEALFPGKIRIVWHNYPLGGHPHAGLAAEAAAEAHAQKGSAGFWRMHELLVEQKHGLERQALEQYAKSAGLDVARFRAALDSHAHQAAVEADKKAGEAAGIDGTPAFVINGFKISGAQPLVKFKKVVQLALSEAGK